MSLRQLKFKPNLQPGGPKLKKCEKIVKTEDCKVEDNDSLISPDPPQIEKTPDDKTPPIDSFDSRKKHDVAAIRKPNNSDIDEIDSKCAIKGKISPKKCTSITKEAINHHPDKKNDEGEKIPEGLLPSNTGSIMLPSLRQFKHKPKLGSINSRSTNKRTKKSNEELLSEKKETSQSRTAFQPASVPKLQASTPHAAPAPQSVSSPQAVPASHPARASEAPNPVQKLPLAQGQQPARDPQSIQGPQLAPVLLSVPSPQPALPQLPAPVLLSVPSPQPALMPLSPPDPLPVSVLLSVPSPQPASPPLPAPVLLSVPSPQPAPALQSAPMDKINRIHRLPVRPLNYKPKVKLPERNSRFSRTTNNNIKKSQMYDNYNDVSFPVANNDGKKPTSDSNSDLFSMCEDLVAENENNLTPLKVNSDPTIQTKKPTGNVNQKKKSLASIITTLTENCTKEMTKKSSFRYPKSTLELDEGLSATDVLSDNSKAVHKRKSVQKGKSTAIYGSKSIRSCHLGIPFKPKLTNRSNRPFASSTFGKMCFEAKQNFDLKFKDAKPDSSKLTMLDLIFYNPESNPMPEEKIPEIDVPIEPTSNSNTEGEVNSKDDRIDGISDGDNNFLPVPQLKLSSDGKIVIAQESLHVEQTLGTISDDIQFETRQRFKRKSPKSGSRTGWSTAETVKFYKALNVLGSDFETMLSLFPGRTRANLKRKFKREEKSNGRLVDKVMSQPSEFDLQVALTELEFGKQYEETVACLGKNLQVKRNPREDHPLFASRRKRSKSVLTAKEYEQALKEGELLLQKKESEMLLKETESEMLLKEKESEKLLKEKESEMLLKKDEESEMLLKKKKESEVNKKDCSVDNTNNIVISTNIEYDKLKYTQYITYDSNNLENPIEINATISHESELDPSLNETFNSCQSMKEISSQFEIKEI